MEGKRDKLQALPMAGLFNQALSSFEILIVWNLQSHSLDNMIFVCMTLSTND